jgi:hypothetical protein
MFLRYGTKAQGTKEKINKALKFKLLSSKEHYQRSEKTTHRNWRKALEIMNLKDAQDL